MEQGMTVWLILNETWKSEMEISNNSAEDKQMRKPLNYRRYSPALLSCVFVVGLLTSIAPAAFANVVYYSFSGEITYSNMHGVPFGTGFTGTFSYDLAASGEPTSSNSASYATGAIDASLLGGDLSSGSGRRTDVMTDLTVGTSAGMFSPADAFDIVGNGLTNSGPLAEQGIAYAIVSFALPVDTLKDLSLPSSISSGSVLGADFGLGDASSGYAGGPLTLETVPEPVTWLLVGPALAGLAMRRRITQRSHSRH
jgi:hypothetical protein